MRRQRSGPPAAAARRGSRTAGGLRLSPSDIKGNRTAGHGYAKTANPGELNDPRLQPPAAAGGPDPLDDFHAWLKTLPSIWTWDWKHQLYLYDRLKEVTDGTCKRLMIFMPPRHGKSEMVTVRYTAWRMLRDPSINVILGSYNQQLANRFSRKIRRVLCDATAPPPRPPAASPLDVRHGSALPEGGNNALEASPPPVGQQIDTGNAPGSASGGGEAALDQSSPVPASQPMFPFTKQRSANSIAEWETAIGGGLRAVGVGGGVTGFGAQLIMIDDPVKNRAQAESPTFRENVWNWYNDDLYTRLEPNGSIILIQTRWHEDDLAGRLVNEMKNGGDQWLIVDLPALAESTFTAETQRRADDEIEDDESGSFSINTVDINRSDDASSQRPGVSAVQLSAAAGGPDPLGRDPGRALWPQRYNETRLGEIKTQLGTYSFSALYQQHPIPSEGSTFKRAWFKQIVESAPPGLRWHRGYDLAVSTKTSADYTASFRVAQDADGNLYIADGFRARIEYPEQRRYIINCIKTERNTSHGIEAALHGQALVQDLLKDRSLAGRPIKAVRVDTDKLTRALSWANRAETGKVFLVRGPWIEDFLDEVLSFPMAKHDDQIDAVSTAVRLISEVGKNKGWGVQTL